MLINGPLPVGPIGQNSHGPELKPFQRVSAEILRVTGTQVILSIDGVPVVAEVPSGELAADLKERSSAQFIVSQVDGGKTILRLADKAQPPPIANGQAADLPKNLPQLLLKEFGLPGSPENELAAQAAINQRLALLPGQMDQLLRTLASLPGWGEQEANLAAAVLVSGLPLTPQSLGLAARPEGFRAENLLTLLGQLRNEAQDSGLPQEMRGLISSVFQALQEIILTPDSAANLPDQLSQAIQFLGRPMENLLMDGGLQSLFQNSQLPPEIQDELKSIFQTLLEDGRSQDGFTDLPEKLSDVVKQLGLLVRNPLGQESEISRAISPGSGLVSLAHLHQLADRTGNRELAQALDDFLQSMSKAQWENIPSSAQNQRQDWMKTDLWMRLPAPNPGFENVPIRLRIDRPPQGGPEKIDADHAHMIVQVDLPGKQVFQVEIGLNQRQVKTDVMVPSAELYDAAREELKSLAVNLEEQGYSLGNARVEVGTAQRFEKITVLPAWGTDLSGVDLEA